MAEGPITHTHNHTQKKKKIDQFDRTFLIWVAIGKQPLAPQKVSIPCTKNAWSTIPFSGRNRFNEVIHFFLFSFWSFCAFGWGQSLHSLHRFFNFLIFLCPLSLSLADGDVLSSNENGLLSTKAVVSARLVHMIQAKRIVGCEIGRRKNVIYRNMMEGNHRLAISSEQNGCCPHL